MASIRLTMISTPSPEFPFGCSPPGWAVRFRFEIPPKWRGLAPTHAGIAVAGRAANRALDSTGRVEEPAIISVIGSFTGRLKDSHRLVVVPVFLHRMRGLKPPCFSLGLFCLKHDQTKSGEWSMWITVKSIGSEVTLQSRMTFRVRNSENWCAYRSIGQVPKYSTNTSARLERFIIVWRQRITTTRNKQSVSHCQSKCWSKAELFSFESTSALVPKRINHENK